MNQTKLDIYWGHEWHASLIGLHSSHSLNFTFEHKSTLLLIYIITEVNEKSHCCNKFFVPVHSVKNFFFKIYWYICVFTTLKNLCNFTFPTTKYNYEYLLLLLDGYNYPNMRVNLDIYQFIIDYFTFKMLGSGTVVKTTNKRLK